MFTRGEISRSGAVGSIAATPQYVISPLFCKPDGHQRALSSTGIILRLK